MERLLLLVLLSGRLLLSANHYVRAEATGSGTGGDWQNAYTSLPTSLTRGDTYYVAAGSYPSGHDFKDVGSTPIRIKKATASDHGASAGWSEAFGNGQARLGRIAFTASHYLLDGSSGGGPGNWETGLGFFLRGAPHVIEFGAVSDITIRHTEIAGNGRSEATDTDLLYLVNRFQGVTVSYCFLHDVSRTMILTWPAGGDGFVLEYSKLARNGPVEHREAWSAGTDTNVTIRHNLFEDILGTGFVALVNGRGDATNWSIYGNVFYHTGKYRDGFINTGSIVNRHDGGTCLPPAICVRAVHWKIFNNAFVNIYGYSSAILTQGPSVDFIVQNNIWFNNHSDASGVSGKALADYNWFSQNTGYSRPGRMDVTSKSNRHDLVGHRDPFADWPAGDWRAAYDIPGLALGSPFDLDALGAKRGADGTWDRGPYEYDSPAGRPRSR